MSVWGSGCGHVPGAGHGVLSFGAVPDDTGLLVVTAYLDGQAAGSVCVLVHGRDQVSVGRLHVGPEYRRRRIAREIMIHVLRMWERADIWLYAEPYRAFPDEPAGPSRDVLERFYASLGFRGAADDAGRPAMVRHAC